jgi:DNA polymerase-3 subunit delta'
MNINASNSLLKTLEEPTADSILLLVTSKPYKLPVTIRSRCQSIEFRTPDQQVATQWLATQTNTDMQLSLQLAHGAPLLALKLADEALLEQRQCLTDALIGVASNKPVTSYSERLSSFSNEYLLRWLYDWLSDLLKVKQSASGQNLSHHDFATELGEFSKRASAQALYQMLDEVLRLRQLQSIPLNNQMLWEDLLISWGRTVHGR